MFPSWFLATSTAASPAAPIPSTPSRQETAEPTGFLEAVRILRVPNSHYDAILHPSEEQLESLQAIIKGLRLELDNGVDAEAGDSTAYELAVTLLWHADKDLIKEGVQLMEFLLKERWDQHWSTVLRTPTPDADESEVARRDRVESVSDDDAEDGQADAASSRSDSWEKPPIVASSLATATGSTVLYGTAVQFATAPPPPEDEPHSVPPSLVRDRGLSSLTTRADSATAVAASASFCAASATAPPAAASVTTVPTTCSTRQTSSTSFTSPGMMSCSTDKAAPSLSRSTDAHHERLSRCYYHLAVGYTKLHQNDKAHFFVGNMLELTPCSKDGLLLRRLLSARLLVRRALLRCATLGALGLLFL